MINRQEKHLMNQVVKDEIYQELLKLREIYEPEYKRILNSLSPQDQQYLIMYFRVCEGIELRAMRTAYFIKPKT